MVIKHNCIVINDGARVIITSFDGEKGPSRRVTQEDWVNIVVPAWHKAGVVRESVCSATGDSVWREE